MDGLLDTWEGFTVIMKGDHCSWREVWMYSEVVFSGERVLVVRVDIDHAGGLEGPSIYGAEVNFARPKTHPFYLWMIADVLFEGEDIHLSDGHVIVVVYSHNHRVDTKDGMSGCEGEQDCTAAAEGSYFDDSSFPREVGYKIVKYLGIVNMKPSWDFVDNFPSFGEW